jgi:hypothetical protein
MEADMVSISREDSSVKNPCAAILKSMRRHQFDVLHDSPAQEHTDVAKVQVQIETRAGLKHYRCHASAAQPPSAPLSGALRPVRGLGLVSTKKFNCFSCKTDFTTFKFSRLADRRRHIERHCSKGGSKHYFCRQACSRRNYEFSSAHVFKFFSDLRCDEFPSTNVFHFFSSLPWSGLPRPTHRGSRIMKHHRGRYHGYVGVHAHGKYPRLHAIEKHGVRFSRAGFHSQYVLCRTDHERRSFHMAWYCCKCCTECLVRIRQMIAT